MKKLLLLVMVVVAILSGCVKEDGTMFGLYEKGSQGFWFKGNVVMVMESGDGWGPNEFKITKGYIFFRDDTLMEENVSLRIVDRNTLECLNGTYKGIYKKVSGKK